MHKGFIPLVSALARKRKLIFFSLASLDNKTKIKIRVVLGIKNLSSSCQKQK
jgi:hypothetical protein